MLDTNLFFWIKGLETPVPVDIGEPLGTSFRLVYAPTPDVQEFLLFYNRNEQISKWNKAVLGEWNGSVIQITRFASPATIPLRQGWRNSLVTWDLNSPIATNNCHEQFKFNKGANFNGSYLHLIDLEQQIAGVPLSQALFDTNFNTGTIKVKKYTPTSTNAECSLGDEDLIDAEIENLRIVPPGQLLEDFEFELLNISL